VTQPPNILVIFNDDHGQWAMPPYGNRELRTPSIDALARGGAVMENAFTPIPVCSPARASFFTGLLPSQHGMHDYLSKAPEFHEQDWLAGLPLLPDLLKGRGYRTGLSGKWHLGRDDRIARGFDDWFSLAGDYPIHHMAANRYCDNGDIRSLAGYKTHLITDRTVQFLRDQPDDQPFFHFSGYYATHSPWADQPERLVAPYRSCSFGDIPSAERVFDGTVCNIELESSTPAARHEAKAQYYAAVSAIDEGVGRIMDELEAQGKLDSTLIVYTSDHGLCLDHHGIWGKGNATSPQNMIEESMRIPMVLHAPGHVVAGSRLPQFADHLDLFQTLLDFSDVPAPDCNFAGVSLRPLLAGQDAPWRDAQFGEYGTARMIRTATHKYIARFDNRPDALFDLTSPEGEGRDLIDVPAAASVKAELYNRLQSHFTNYQSAPPDPAEFFGQPRFNPAEAWR